jgi:hypothetical protein
MKNTRRIITGLLFAATLAVSLTANGGDAYAKVRSGGGQASNNNGDTGTLPIAIPTSAPDLFQTLGITWE